MGSDISAKELPCDHAVIENMQLFQTIADSIPSAIFIFQGDNMCYVNPAAQSITGYTKDELLAMPFWAIVHEDSREIIKLRGRDRQSGTNVPVDYEVQLVRKDGEVGWYSARVSMIELAGKPAVMGVIDNISERKQVEEKQAAHLRFFENMDRIDRVISQTTDSEQMMSEILQTALDMFETDRAWLLYPCDPEAKSWNVPMERTRPEYPGAFVLGEYIPMLPEKAEIMRQALDENEVIIFDSRDAGTPKETDERFSILAQMHMAVYPRTGKPWLFGMHQCSHSRDWTDEEKKLFREISHRLGDLLSSLLFQRNLQVSEMNFRNLAEIDCYALVVHRDFHLLYANSETQKLFKVQRMDSIVGKSIFDYIHPRYHNFAKLSIKRVIRRNESIAPIQIKGVTTSGQEIDLELRSIPIHFNVSPAIMTIIYDITERKQAEEVIKTLVASIVGQTGQGFFDNLVVQLAQWLNVECVILGELTDEDQINTLAMVLDEELIPYYSYALTGAPCGEVVNKGFTFYSEGISRLFPNDDELLNLGAESYVGTPLRDTHGNNVGILCAIGRSKLILPKRVREMLEIIASKAVIEIQNMQAENELFKLSQAIEQAGESILITDRKGIIEYVNPAFTALTGYSAEEAIGQTPRLLKSGNQDATFYKDMWDTINDGNTWHGKVIDRKKDGSFYPTTLTISPIYDQSGDATSYSHFVGIQSDLSKLEYMEQQFHQAQKMEAIGTLVGGIAHDFNNMLAGMTGNLYLAKQRVHEMSDVVQKLDNVESIAFRASDMIQQLLTFARKGSVSMKEMPCTPFIKETLKLLRTSVPENIEMRQDICSDALLIKGDSTQLHQMLMNLVSNACDALEGIDDARITVRLEAFHMDDEFSESHPYFKAVPYAHLSVEDNGTGIPEHQIEHLFEPFFTTKKQGKGTGLGLAMVFGAIKTHHGFVEVKSIDSEGSTFHIYLPLLEPKEVAPASLQEQEAARGHGEMILLVDDQQHIIETGKEVLESLGYQVLTATNGRQAIDIFKAHSEEIDLCIFDIVMPVMSGDKAAQHIRWINSEIKIIFSTGYDKNIRTDMVNETVLSKPFSIVKMSHLIRKQLET